MADKKRKNNKTKTSIKPQSKEETVVKLDEEIEKLELHDMSTSEIERTISAFSTEGMEIRRARKKVRYQLYRLRSDAEGIAKSESDI